MILIIDNYDSFTFNLAQYFGELYKGKLRVARNDKISLDQIGACPEAIVVSPGPCTPKEAGISVDTIKTFGPTMPLLGVCLGHQSIGYAFGGNVIRAPYLMHGKVSEIHHDGKQIYKGLPNPFIATRYHSLIIERKSCPVPRNHQRDRRRHHHGRSAQRISDRGSAVSSGIYFDDRGKAVDKEFYRGHCVKTESFEGGNR